MKTVGIKALAVGDGFVEIFVLSEDGSEIFFGRINSKSEGDVISGHLPENIEHIPERALDLRSVS